MNLTLLDYFGNIFNSFCREDGAEESEVRVGFVTYAKQIHFYNVKVRKM